MRRLFGLLAIAVLVVVVFALLGDSLPEGPLRDAAEGIRAFGRGLGSGFGGGYGELPAAP